VKGIEGRNVLITGAGGAIGQEVVRQFLHEGARALLLTDLPGSDVEGAGEALRAAGANVTAQSCDAADPTAVAELISSAQQAVGEIDILVNVAGAWQIVDFVDSDAAQWNAMIRANLVTAMSASHAVLPPMLARGRGVIVNFASTAGEFGSIRPSAAYAAAKGGVIAFTKSLAREVSPAGVRVNAISPGPIDTPALKAATADQRAEAAARTLLGRLGEPLDMARGVIYLAGDDSAFMTGAVLQVNGGSLL
jgi:2-hydroxycyclohexanecarboxyl-CoA dehydrogenase